MEGTTENMSETAIVAAEPMPPKALPKDAKAVKTLELQFQEYHDILNEVRDQPRYRRQCDIAADYYDGNQLDTETLQFMAKNGMAPIVENLISPTIDAVLGLEAKTRKDWKVTSQNVMDDDDLADALNQKLYEAEKTSHADRAISEAFKAQCVPGIGWVEVLRESDPFKEPYRVEYVNRNEMAWDMNAKLPDKSDAMWMMRSRWFDIEVLKQAFPKHATLLECVGDSWGAYSGSLMELTDGGESTSLAMSHDNERAFTVEDHEWRNTSRKRLRLTALWYKRYVTGYVFRAPNGAMTEFNDKNPDHIQAIHSGVQLRKANFSKLRVSFWTGAHKLSDDANPFAHGRYPYVPFIGKEEDMTGIPYGLVRPMIPMQDEINARNTKSIWLLAAKRVTMTAGATIDDIELVRQEAGRPDAMHILNKEEMQNGGIFKVETDFQLNAQQYQAMADKRVQLKAVAGVFAAFEGSSNQQSGIALQQATEQSSQTLACIYDNNEYSRALVGELLLSLIIEDIGQKPQTVVIKSEFGAVDKSVEINKENPDGTISNQISMIRAKVALSDVPTTSSFKAQTLQTFSQINQGLPPQYQGILFKFMMKLTDISGADKAEIMDEIARMNGEQVNKPPKNEEEAAAQQAAAQKAAAVEQLQIRDATATVALKEAQVAKAQAEAQKLLGESSNGQMNPELEAKNKEIEELEADLEEARIAFDTKIEEANIRKATAIEVARMNIEAKMVLANNELLETIKTLENEMSEIEKLMGLEDSQASDTANKQQTAQAA